MTQDGEDSEGPKRWGQGRKGDSLGVLTSSPHFQDHHAANFRELSQRLFDFATDCFDQALCERENTRRQAAHLKMACS